MKFSALLIFSFLVSAPAFALDLGGPPASTDKPLDVNVVNESENAVPVLPQALTEVREVMHETQLDFGGESESQYTDVRDFRNVTFYVIIEKTLNEPQPDVRYKLDAFFSVDASTTTYKKMGEPDEKLAGTGWQQFGNMQMRDENPPGQPYFTFLSTGETGARALSTPVYGPFVRVVLRSLTQADRRKFRVVAFLSQ